MPDLVALLLYFCVSFMVFIICVFYFLSERYFLMILVGFESISFVKESQKVLGRRLVITQIHLSCDFI